MSDTMRITAEIEDVQRGAALVPGARRRVSLEIELPTGEGSEGPNLDAEGWEDAVSTVAQRAVGGAQFALRAGDGQTDAELKYLDSTLDKVSQRVDALEAEVAGLAAGLVREDAELAKRLDALAWVARGLAGLEDRDASA